MPSSHDPAGCRGPLLHVRNCPIAHQEIAMIELVMTVCLMAQPEDCRKERLPFDGP